MWTGQTRTNGPYVQKVVCLVFAQLNVCPVLRTYFSLKYQLQTGNIRLFTEHSPHKQMQFAAPRLLVYINIFLISACLVRIRMAFVYRCGRGFKILRKIRKITEESKDMFQQTLW